MARSVQQFKRLAEGKGYSVVREYGGHGIGRELWEEPFVPHIGPADMGALMREGLVINIEPMINSGRADTRLMSDEWSVETADGSLSAQFEHTVAVTDHGPDILTLLKFNTYHPKISIMKKFQEVITSLEIL